MIHRPDQMKDLERLASASWPLWRGQIMPADTLIVTDYRPLPEQQLEPPPDSAGTPGEEQDEEIGVDVTTALRRALRDVPVKGVVPGASRDRGDRVTTILFPGLPRGFTYLLTERVEI